MKSKTYDEWIKSGFHVMRGEKSSSRNPEGKAMFSEDQVLKNKTRYFDEYGAPMSKQAFESSVMEAERYESEDWDRDDDIGFGFMDFG